MKMIEVFKKINVNEKCSSSGHLCGGENAEFQLFYSSPAIYCSHQQPKSQLFTVYSSFYNIRYIYNLNISRVASHMMMSQTPETQD